MEQPFISICIPVYNGGDYVGEAVRSALAQDYPRFEVVVCDNLSTDGTASVLEGFGDVRLRVHYATEHVGMAENWNRTIALSRGERVLVLSADDRLLPGALRVLGDAVLRHPEAEVFVGRASYLVEGGGRVLDRGFYRHVPGPVADFEQFSVGNPFPVNINAMLLRTELACFREDCGVVTDLDMMIRFGIAARKVVLLGEELIHYRVHAGATSANRLKMFRESLAVYRDYLDKTTKPALYRMRLFRTLFWCVIYLVDQGETATAWGIVREYRQCLGFRHRAVLACALMVPWRLSVMERARALRAKWIGAR